MIGVLDAWWGHGDPGVRHRAGAADGYAVELRHLWQGDRLVALNQQTFAAG